MTVQQVIDLYGKPAYIRGLAAWLRETHGTPCAESFEYAAKLMREPLVSQTHGEVTNELHRAIANRSEFHRGFMKSGVDSVVVLGHTTGS